MAPSRNTQSSSSAVKSEPAAGAAPPGLYGEPHRFDASFRGPVRRRNCTDILCCLIFIIAILSYVALGIVAGRACASAEDEEEDEIICRQSSNPIYQYDITENLSTRFHDLHVKRPQITFLVDPFNAETDCLKAPLVKDEAVAELEMIELSEDDRLKPVLREGTLEFWKTVPIEKYPNVNRAALKLLSMFGSTYVLATTEYKPDLRRIVQSKECQKSH
ncbi:Choline transporter-like protein 5 [Dissostichus eleginoides]|uniref:Choline transporter-like protein 5 n=1 Tax=Dissostichus eleginoides TaxID=100907 RepID=A0AAD9B8E6_DISEL|nr:Choline transporter-like protein 5 [Dissostichus eleginoides]